MPDDRTGELPRAYVVTKPNVNVSPPEIIKYVEGLIIFTSFLRFT